MVPLSNSVYKLQNKESKIQLLRKQKSYHPQQELYARGLWQLEQQCLPQRELCYSFYLLHWLYLEVGIVNLHQTHSCNKSNT